MEQFAAQEEVGKTPEHSRYEVQDEVRLLLLPWPVEQRDEQQGNIGYCGGERNQGVTIHIKSKDVLRPSDDYGRVSGKTRTENEILLASRSASCTILALC